MEDDQEFEDLKKRLEPFPNYFQLELQKVSRNTWKNVKQKLEAEEEEAHTCQSDMEIHRDKNLKACVYYELGDCETADRLIGEVLKSSRNTNVNASAMMALIQYKNGMFAESDNIMGQLETLKDSGDTFLIDEAFAEMAYGYSRIDAKYYTKAVDYFEDVICKRQSTQHKDFVFIWKFGLALTLRRCNHLDLRTLHPDIIPDKTSKRADDLLIDIIDNCRNDVYIARACIERANLCSNFVDSRTHIDKQLVESLIKEGVNKAPNDHVILAKAGRLMRHIYKFREAEEYLRKSVHIRETSLALHQLGLLLKGKLKARQKREKNNSRGRGRGTGRGSWKSWSRTNSLVEYNRTNYNSTCVPQFMLPTSPISRPPPRQTQRNKSVKPIRLFSCMSTSNETSPQHNPGLKDGSKSDPHLKILPFGSLAKESMSDRQSMPKRGGFTLEDENDKGSSKPVLVNTSDNPIPESKNMKSTVYKDDKLNSHPIMEICPELASLSLEPKKAQDIISYHQVLDNSGPSNVTHVSTDIQPTVDRTQSDVLNLQTYAGPTAVDESHKESLTVKCVIDTKCDIEEDSEMTDIFEHPYSQEIRLGSTPHHKYPESKYRANNQVPEKGAYIFPADALCKGDENEYKDIKSSSSLITPFNTETVDSTTETVDSTTETVDNTTETVDSTTETVDSTTETVDSTTKTVDTPFNTETVDSTTGTVDSTTETVDITTETGDITTETIDSTTEIVDSTTKFQEKDVQDIEVTVIKEVIFNYSDDTINKVTEVKSNQGKDLSDANKAADTANRDKDFDVDHENKTLTKAKSMQMDFKEKYPGIVSSLSPDAKPFVPSTKLSVACDTQIRYLRAHSSPILEYGSSMGLFSRILKSPGHDQVAIYDKNSKYQLEECLTMFQKSYDISQGRNRNAAYDMGLTYLQMTPPQYEKAREAFRKTFDCNSPLSRYRGFEQSGICLVHMSQESDSKRNDHEKDAFEMFKRAIRCWGLCQKATPIFHNPNQHLHSLKSIRQLILGEEGRSRTKKVKEVADLHYCVREYGESLGLYKELKVKLERSNDAKDLDITKGIIKNNVKLGNFSDVLDLILILVNSREGFESKAFILEVLLEIIKSAINNENTNVIKSVFDIYRRLKEYDGDDDDIVVIYDEETVGGQIFGWLQKLSGLKITKNDDNVPINHLRKLGQIEIISNSEAVIFIIAEQEKETDYREYLVGSALEAIQNKKRLSKIVPITVNNCSLPSSLWAFKRLPYPRNNLDTDIHVASWLCSFCDILLSS
ncbi:uncharacterized protein LOC126828253 [Patella vulgata]|uniref:uncharacterized protein LOC126828253 n=1 Tax=Patella vulgata TaxID=6465 RepID=UPI0024A932DB|nr:uncharacterized protein LOC126828253 [Patella vulgata]